jgi:hypothetical protein
VHTFPSERLYQVDVRRTGSGVPGAERRRLRERRSASTRLTAGPGRGAGGCPGSPGPRAGARRGWVPTSMTSRPAAWPTRSRGPVRRSATAHPRRPRQLTRATPSNHPGETNWPGDVFAVPAAWCGSAAHGPLRDMRRKLLSRNHPEVRATDPLDRHALSGVHGAILRTARLPVMS